MKRLFIIFLFLSSFCLALAEESKITIGTPIATVEDMLTKNGFQYGNQFQLQWVPPKGQRDLFCRLDDKATLAVGFSTKTKKVVYLVVWYAAPVMQTRADGVSVAPVAVTLTPNDYSLTFKKEPNQQPENTSK